MDNQIRLLLVDDQEIFIQGLSQLIAKKTHDIIVVDILKNGLEAVDYIKTKNPVDVILMDIKMPVMNGVEATRQIHLMNPDIRILVLTTFDEDDYIIDAIHLGASGYILKDVELENLILDIRALNSGTMQFSPSVMEKLADLTTNVKKRLKDHTNQDELIQFPNNEYPYLSSRELKILSYIVEGLSNKEIASRLFLGNQTVRNYISIIYEKIGIKDRFEVIGKFKKYKFS